MANARTIAPETFRDYQYRAAAAQKLRRAEQGASDAPSVSRWIPHAPTPKQEAFLALTCHEALYGGAAGGGKSDAILMGALKYVEVSDYRAIIFRNTFADLSLPDGLIPRSHEWLAGTGARWSGVEHTWHFPSGASLTFGYLDSRHAHLRYKGMAAHFIGYDELTEIQERHYRYLMSRNRRSMGSEIPLMIRSASNPGGKGHDWVKRRFVDGNREDDCVFAPARLDDNPYIDRKAYELSLSKLDSVDRRQLREGDWNALREGNLLKGECFGYVAWREAEKFSNGSKRIRYWDLAATVPNGRNDPDYTAGALCSIPEKMLIWDIQRLQASPVEVERILRLTAARDGPDVEIWIEQEPGAAGKGILDHYRRNVLQGYAVRADKKTGSKRATWKPFIALAENGDVVLVEGAWNGGFVDEVTSLDWEGDNGVHDDQLDTVSGAFGKLTRKPFLIS